MWLMIIGCLTPMLVIGILLALGVRNAVLTNIFFFGMALLCPLMHIFMMGTMHGHGDSHQHHHEADAKAEQQPDGNRL